MNSKSIVFAAAAALLLTTPQVSAQQPQVSAPKNCNVLFGWWESPGLVPFFINPKGGAPKTDCDFQILGRGPRSSTRCRRDPTTKQPKFLSLPTYDDLKSGNALRAATRPAHASRLKPRGQKPKSMGSFQQAGSAGVLVDQRGRAVDDATHMDLTYFKFTQTYFGPARYAKAAPTLPLPDRCDGLQNLVARRG